MAGFRPQLPRRAGGRGSVIATLANPAAIIAALVLVAGAVRLTEVYLYNELYPSSGTSHYQVGFRPV